MTITLYKNTSDKNVLHKTLSDGIEITGTLKDSSNVVNPEILIQTDNPTGYNYLYIPDFGRYYYIQEMQIYRTGLWRIMLNCDVLMSFSEQIEKCTGTVTDGTDTGSRYLSGGQWRVTQKNKTDILTFPSGFEEQAQYILITSGG